MLNSFADVERHYNNIKPINGSATPKSLDVRPLGGRKFKYQRVVKISDDCYALSDGAWDWFRVRVTKYVPVDAPGLEYIAPIVWRRSSDGTETVEIRLGVKILNPTRKYFFRQYLPTGIQLSGAVERKGKYVFCRGKEGQVKHWLPIMKHKDDRDSVLVCERTEQGFELVSEPMYRELTRINKEDKAPYINAVKEYTEWLYTMLPLLLPHVDINTKRSLYDISVESVKCIEALRYAAGTRDLTHFIRGVISTPENEARVILANYLILKTGYEREYRTLLGSIEYQRRRTTYDAEHHNYRPLDHVQATIDEMNNKFIKSRKAAFRKALNEIAGFTHSVEVK